MKISIVGVGRVGSATAYALVVRGIAEEIVLVGRTPESALGDAYDLAHAAAFVRPMKIRSGSVADTAHSDIVILTHSVDVANPADRLSLASGNADLFRKTLPAIARASPHAILIVVTNPVDVMSYLTLRLTGFDRRRVMGTGTLIDTGRFRQLLSQESGINAQDVRAYILGEHGDSQFPALSVASAGGVRLPAEDASILRMAEEAKNAGATVVSHKGYTNYAVATSTLLIVEAIQSNSNTVLPVSTLIDGYLGVRDVCLSIPSVIGRSGVVRTLPVDLNEREAEQFRASAELMKRVIKDVDA